MRDTNFDNVRCRWKESALRHLSDDSSIDMKASNVARHVVNIPEKSLPVMPSDDLMANVSTSEKTQMIDVISRSSMGPKMSNGVKTPPIDRNHGGGCCDSVSSRYGSGEQ